MIYNVSSFWSVKFTYNSQVFLQNVGTPAFDALSVRLSFWQAIFWVMSIEKRTVKERVFLHHFDLISFSKVMTVVTSSLKGHDMRPLSQKI